MTDRDPTDPVGLRAMLEEARDLVEEHEIALRLLAAFYTVAYSGVLKPGLSRDEWAVLNKALQGA